MGQFFAYVPSAHSGLYTDRLLLGAGGAVEVGDSRSRGEGEASGDGYCPGEDSPPSMVGS